MTECLHFSLLSFLCFAAYLLSYEENYTVCSRRVPLSKLSALHHLNHQCKLAQHFQQRLVLLSDELKDAYDVNNRQNKRCLETEVISFEMCADGNQPWSWACLQQAAEFTVGWRHRDKTDSETYFKAKLKRCSKIYYWTSLKFSQGFSCNLILIQIVCIVPLKPFCIVLVYSLLSFCSAVL